MKTALPRFVKALGITAHEGALMLLLGIVLALAARLDPSFLTRETQLELSTHAVELALLALPMTLIIISGGVDLSVGSILALSAVALGLAYEAGAPMPLAALAALVTGTLAGALNAFFIARIKVEPLIVTLASLAAFRGLAEGVSRARPISGFPDSFLRLGGGSLYGVPIPLLIVVVAAMLAMIFASRTPAGFRVYALGNNETAARYSAIHVARLKFMLYTASGLVAGVAGVLLAARRNTAKADLATSIELEVITAVVLGGTSIFGGKGRIFGTLLGVILIHEVREFVSWRWQKDELILIVIGAILIASVLLNNLASRWRR